MARRTSISLCCVSVLDHGQDVFAVGKGRAHPYREQGAFDGDRQIERRSGAQMTGVNVAASPVRRNGGERAWLGGGDAHLSREWSE